MKKKTKENFNLEATQNQTKLEVDSHVSDDSCFRLDTNITRSVSSDSLHKHQTDNSATYNIRAHAEQQPPPSEDMAKLNELFAQMTESVPKKNFQNSQHGRKNALALISHHIDFTIPQLNVTLANHRDKVLTTSSYLFDFFSMSALVTP